MFALEADSLILLDRTILLCDTFISREAGFYISDRTQTDNELTFKANIDNKSRKFELTLTSDLIGEFCVEKECFDVERTDQRVDVKQSAEKRLIQGWKYELGDQIVQSQRGFENVNSSLFSKRAKGVLATIDSTRENLLQHIGVNYEAISCWHRLDSILAYKYPTEILVGEIPYSPREGKYSGLKLKDELHAYLSSLTDTSSVTLLFPEFKSNRFEVLNAYGQVDSWEINKFYHRPLGRVITELNTLKLKIAQLETIRAERKTTR